ncbi:DNA mismatch repair protein MutT, partial [Vibrio rotiferianus]
MVDKVCPLVLRNQNSEILLFKHPLAGIQLVKGTVESFDGD